MRAIVLEKFGGLDSLVYKDIPEPEPKAAMSRLMLKSAKRASLIENLRSLRGLGKMRVR